MAWQDFYAHPGGRFGIKDPRFYGPDGHRGQDFPADRGQSIPIYEPGVCVFNGFSAYLGYVTVIKLSDGEYAGFAHLQVGTRPDIGQKLKAGDSIGKAAGAQDTPGISWDGAHCHTTRSTHLYGIWEGKNLDPLPRIQKAIKSAPKPPAAKPAADNITPIHLIDEEQEMDKYVYVTTEQAYLQLRADGTVRKIPSSEWRAITAAYTAAGKPRPLGKVNQKDYDALLKAK